MADMQGALAAERELGGLIGQAQAQDDAFMEQAALTGSYTPTGVKRLARALEAALKEMGMPGEEGRIDQDQALGEDGTATEALMRPLMMAVDPINDAVEQGILDADLAIDLALIQDDQDMTMLGSRIRTAFADRDFKRWLKEQTGETGEEEEAEPSAEPAAAGPGPMSDEELDDYFISTMG